MTGNQMITIDGKNYRIPQWQVTQKLSNDQQKLLDLQEQAGINLGELARDQSRRVGNLLNRPISTNGLPNAVQNAPNAPGLQQAQGDLTPGYESMVGTDWSQDRQRVEEALMSRLNPQLDRDRNSMLTRLANQGVTQGSEAYNNEVDVFNRQSNDARMQAILAGGQEQSRLFGIDMGAKEFSNRTAQQALMDQYREADHFNQIRQSQFGLQNDAMQNQQTLRQQHLQEDAFLRQQPLSEISQLLHGSSPTMPQFQPFNAPTVANTPVGQYHYQTAALEQQNYQSQLQAQNAAMGGMYGLGSSLLGMFSDSRLKEGIERIGTADNGLPIYVFRYKTGGPAQIGFMAEEVEEMHPEAIRTAEGYKLVDYTMAVKPRVGA